MSGSSERSVAEGRAGVVASHRGGAAAVALLAAALAWAGEARAQAPAPQRFFLRVALGGGWGTNVASVQTPMEPAPISLVYEGGGALGALSLGAFVAPGVAVHVDASAVALLSPAIVVDGMPWPDPITVDFTTSTSMVGAGFTWVHRTNAWLSASLGLAQVSVELPFERAAGHALTALGVGGQVMAGRDWRVAEHWYVGGAVLGMFAYIPEAPFGVVGVPAVWVSGGVGAAVTVVNR